ncbi:MAG: phosphotransferase [Psychrobacillus sp.]
MDINKIINKLGITSYSSLEEVQGGKDCLVYKVQIRDGTYLAIRIQQAERYNQFLYEKNIKKLALESGIPVPIVYSVIVEDSYAVMLMEWIKGLPVLQMLKEKPAIAHQLGVEFGKTHATIHQVTVPESLEIRIPNWLTPIGTEKKIFEKLSLAKESLIHLDFHPLNVLTDGSKITGVIDWTNAAIGDPRFDYARTLSILQIEGYRHFKEDLTLIKEFEAGWSKGYESVNGVYNNLPPFMVWAAIRMHRDKGNSLGIEQEKDINEWINSWGILF